MTQHQVLQMRMLRHLLNYCLGIIFKYGDRSEPAKRERERRGWVNGWEGMLLKEERQRQLAIKVSQGVTRREAYRRKSQQQCQKVQMSHRNPEIRHKSSQVLLF